jgi:hypothetical protein
MSADLERDLRALGERLEWPATPDIASAMEQRLGEVADPTVGRRRSGQPRRFVRRRLVVALAALVLVPAGAAFGDEVLEWLGLKSVEVERVPRLPDDARRPVVDGLGERVSLAQAERRAGFAPVVPDALGSPQEIRIDGRVVTLVYRRGDVLLAQLPGALDRNLLTKIAGPGTDVRRVPDGLFFSGREHAYLYRRPGGEVAEDRPRLAGDTFVTERGDVLLRLEAPRLTVARARALLR